jgi:hypothetical protein
MSTQDKKPPPEAKLTADEAWDALATMGADDEVDRVLGLSDAQLDAELKEAGADPAAVRARGEALGRELDVKRAETKRALGGTGRDAPAKAERAPSRMRRRWVAWGVPAVAAAAATTALVLGGGGGVLVGHPAPQRAERAAMIRDEALADCARRDFDGCRAKLDAAKDLDPEGERDARVVKAREDIARAGAP